MQAIGNVLEMTNEHNYDILVACAHEASVCQIDIMAPPSKARVLDIPTECRPVCTETTAANYYVCPDAVLWSSSCGPGSGEGCDSTSNCAGDFRCTCAESSPRPSLGNCYCCQKSPTECFPGDAVVQTRQGPRIMASLRLGDRVLTDLSWWTRYT